MKDQFHDLRNLDRFILLLLKLPKTLRRLAGNSAPEFREEEPWGGGRAHAASYPWLLGNCAPPPHTTLGTSSLC